MSRIRPGIPTFKDSLINSFKNPSTLYSHYISKSNYVPQIDNSVLLKMKLKASKDLRTLIQGYAIHYLESGNVILTGDENGVIRAHDADTFNQKAELNLKTFGIVKFASGKKTNRSFYCCTLNSIKQVMYSSKEEKFYLVRTIKKKALKIFDILLIPERNLLLICGEDTRIEVWNTKTNRKMAGILSCPEQKTCMTYIKLYNLLAVAIKSVKILIYSLFKKEKLWDINTGSTMNYPLTSLPFISGPNLLVIPLFEGKIVLWYISKKAPRKFGEYSVQGAPRTVVPINGGLNILFSSEDNKLFSLDLETGAMECCLESKELESISCIYFIYKKNQLILGHYISDYLEIYSF